jgi:hypothetical protein
MKAEASEAAAAPAPAAAALAAAPSSRLYTLYFIRHGEAMHNRLEKLAKSAALANAYGL